MNIAEPALIAVEGDSAVIAGHLVAWNGEQLVDAGAQDLRSYDFEALAHLAFPLQRWNIEGSNRIYLLPPTLRGQWPDGAHILATNIDDGIDVNDGHTIDEGHPDYAGWYEVLPDTEGSQISRVTDLDPYDGTHNGDTIWAYRRYLSPHDGGSGPWLYAIYSSSDPICSLVELAAPPDQRPTRAGANCVLWAPSLDPEPGDPIWILYHDPSAAATPGDEGADPPVPALPAQWSTLFSDTWTGVYENGDQVRVALLLPGDDWPRGLFWVTQDRFLQIPLNVGTELAIFCSLINAPLAGLMGPLVLYGSNGGEAWPMGGPDVRSDANSFQPPVLAASQVMMVPGDYSDGPLGDDDSAAKPIVQAFHRLNAEIGLLKGRVTTLEG